MFKKLTLLITLAFGLCWSGISDMMAQTPDEYIYFDLAAGDVIFSGGNYTGHVYVNGISTEVTATHDAANKYYIYQSSTVSGNNDNSHTGYATTEDFTARQNCRVPNYPAVSYGGRAWSDYITDNSDVSAVQTNWNNAISGTERTATTKRICFRNNNSYNVVLDNVYSTFETDEPQRRNGGITIGHTEGDSPTLLTNCKVTLKLKGDSRVSSIFYYSGEETDKSELHLTSYDGDGSNSGSITVASYIINFSRNNSCCIGSGATTTPKMSSSYRTYFDGGTVFAGMPKWVGTGVWTGSNHVTHVIGSRHHTGVIINGGRITAVSNSTAAAIGGGGGYAAAGGEATVDIKGGYVYAYNHSIYVTSTYNLFVPCVAIGGSSSVESSAALTTINIMGGHVFAQSKGGCAIGGGGSAKEAGGPANINISGDAYVEAKSLAGSIGGHSFPAGSSIGGGTGGTNANMNGGNAIFHIDGGTLRAGSVGGGSTLSSTGNVGYVEAYITDGDVQAQFMMAAGSTEHCIFKMSGGTLHGSDYTSTSYPLVKNNGGAVWMDDPNGVATISGGEIYDNNASNGGAFYMTGGQLNITGGKIYGNTAATNGGSAYMGGGNFEMSNGEVSGNTANTSGGGFYVNGGSITITGGEVMNNTATSGNGGGFYSAGGTVNISNAEISGNKAENGNGGGLYSAAAITVGGETEGSGATISGNEAKNGGGFYVAGADDATTTIQSSSIVSNNRATVNGAGAFIESGNLTVKTSDINGNTADSNGGGFYVQGGLSTISGGTVQNNKATNGAGLYMKGIDATHWVNATFTDGTFMQNSATTAGGGIYLDNYSNLYMSGESTIRDNTAGEKGGGVFKTAGNEHSMLQISGTSLIVFDNMVGGQRSNVYLDSYSDYITVDPVVGVSDHIKVGISVNVSCSADLPTPILHCDDVSKLNDIFIMLKNPAGTSGLFDDAGKYLPVYQSDPGPFNENEIFFITTWAAEVTEPENFDLTRISTPAELAWFMVLVNGLRDLDANPELDGTLINDIDMSAYYWTPIGEWDNGDEQVSHAIYNGTFDGQGHTISGIKTCGIINYYNYGLFGHTGSNADIKNVVLADCDITAGESQRMGSLIAVMDGGLVENCVAGGRVIVTGSETQDGGGEFYCVAGGMVGETKGNAIIRNCISSVDVEAEKNDGEIYVKPQNFTVGGLVGKTSVETKVENSLVNTTIKHSGEPDPSIIEVVGRYAGGIVGYNQGKITNTYVRLDREGTTLDATYSKFGMFAGYNGGTIDYCYAPDEDLFANHTYVHTSNSGTLTNYGDYDAVVCPYTYEKYNKDNLVTMNGAGATSGSLLDKLNAWVDNPSTSKDAPAISYSRWMRTSASPINGDYPVLSFDNLDGTLDYTTVGSKDGIQLEYGHSVNPMITRFNGYADGGSLYIYKTPGEMQTSRGGDPTFTGETITEANDANVNIYLQQDVALKNDVDLQNVNACVVLDNSEAAGQTGDNYYWHMFSTPLTDAPLGIDYTEYEAAGSVYGTPSVVNFTNVDSYFPTDTPYGKWDFYCYNEKHSTWINYKRATGDHYDTYTEHNITEAEFKNEEELIPGKGYLAAADTDFKQGLFLQAKGMLNKEVKETEGTKESEPVVIQVDVTCEGHHVTGCNFIGNPYHAYLDFDKFSGKNGISSYSVIADGSYVSYVVGASDNPDQALRYIHPHQGFLVKVNAAGTLSFTPDMAVVNQTSPYREAHVDYPLVNLFASDSEGNREVATAELGRPENGGALKIEGMQMGKCTMSISNQGERYGIAFIEGNPEEVAVHFHATEDGDFTMKWNTYNGTFSYLHLIDNLTGMDIDCLSQSEYKFTASTGDYASRFKLKFEFTGVEENESASANSASFAFFHQGSLVVNGQGNLELIDLSGRVLMTKNLGEGQSTVALPEVPEGLYLLRLADDSNVKTQKIIIK